MIAPLTDAAKAELAARGRLRVGLNHSNFLLVSTDPATGAPHGIAPDIGREIARRLGVPVEFVSYDAAGKLADAARSGAWDVALLGAEPQRANEIAFSPAYLEIEATYLVPAGSRIQSVDEVDRPGVRIAVAERSAYDLYLSRSLKHAELVRAPGVEASFRLFLERNLEVLSGLKPRLLMDREALPGSRILDGRFTAIQQAIGTPRERAAAAAYLAAFAEEIKGSGFVADAIARNGVRGVTVAPPAQPR